MKDEKKKKQCKEIVNSKTYFVGAKLHKKEKSLLVILVIFSHEKVLSKVLSFIREEEDRRRSIKSLLSFFTDPLDR